MALKSSREGLRKELVDYLGNIIIDDNLKQNIINSVNDVFIDNEELSTSVNELDEKIRNETSARESTDSSLESNKANKSDVLSLEEIQASTDLSGKIASASSVLLSNYIAKLSGNYPESSSIEYTLLPFPDGYSQDNCRVLTVEHFMYGYWYPINVVGESGVDILLGHDGVRVQHPSLDSKFYGVPYRITLLKY